MKKNTGRGRRSLIIVLIVVAALIVAGVTGWNFFKYRLIKHKVSNLLYKNSDGLYTVEYDSLHVDEVAGDLSIAGLRLIPDTARYRELHDSNQPAPSILVAATIPLLRITGVKTPQAILNKEIEGGKVEINNADILLYHARSAAGPEKDTAQSPSMQETCLQLLNKLHMVKADTLSIENASLGFIDFLDNEKRMQGASISLHLYHILIDSASVRDTSRIFFAQQADASVQKVVVNDKEGMYHVALDEAWFTSASRALTLKNFRLAPLLGEEEMMRMAGMQVDRFDVHCPAVTLKNINLPRLMTGEFVADSLNLERTSVKIFRDLNFIHPDKSMLGKYPHQILMKLLVPYHIKRVQAQDAFIEYKEKNKRSDSSGKVQFYHSAISIKNLTNIDADIARDNSCLLNFDTRLLNLIPLKSVIVLKLKDANGRFTVKGTLGGFDATQLNPLLGPMALAQVKKGQVTKLNFQLNGDNNGATGKLLMLYHDLTIEVLKKEEGKSDLKEKKLATLLANLVVKNANPLKRDKGPREANINFQRIMNKSFFNLIWKSLLSGIKQTVGM